MPFLLQPFHVMIVVLGEFVRMEQEKQIEYHQVESQILREKIGGSRVLLGDDHPPVNLQPLTTDFVTQLNRCTRDRCAPVSA